MAAFRLQIVITNNYFVEEFSSGHTEKKTLKTQNI